MNLLSSESVIRLGCFAGVLTLMALWEVRAPRRPLTTNKPRRWASNLGLLLLNTIAVRFLQPLGAVGAALAAQERGWGLLNNLPLPAWLVIVLAVVALDFVIYLQHVLFHAVPILWRLHLVHHADLDFDVTTGVRFHTLEILISLGIKWAAVIILGAPAVAVLAFEILLNATSMFNHGNVRFPACLDRILRLLVVTPEMHRVHHSAIPSETNRNFGFNLPWWDFLFGTYQAQPAEGHERMTVGLSQLRDEQRADRLPWMLALPLLGLSGRDSVGRRESHEELPSPGTPPNARKEAWKSKPKDQEVHLGKSG
jgi:sterol desaturase/sphingolipid hydroxylase (fatty acid hydroxylase superfamily)